MVNSIEDYELSFALALYEQEMFESLTGIETDFILNENQSAYVLLEGVKETIMQYLNKVMTQIQKVWTKFKTTIATKFGEKLQQSVTKMIATTKNQNVSFTVKNLRSYDFDKLNQFQVKPWSTQEYIQKKENFESVKAYTTAYYPQMNTAKNFKEAMLATMEIGDVTVDNKYLLKLVAFFKQDYKNLFTDIEKDLDAFNNSSKQISMDVNTVTAATTPAQESYAFLESTCLGLFTEADDNKDDQKMSFVDNNGEESGTNKEADKSKSQFTKAVSVYMTVSTKILSAKMGVINSAASDYAKVLMHFMKFYKDNRTGVTSSNKPNTAVQNVPQIKK